MNVLRLRHRFRDVVFRLAIVIYTLIVAASSDHSNKATDDSQQGSPLSLSLSASSFDESLARQIVNFTQAAYCVDQLVDWNCTVCGNFPGMRNVSILQGKSRNVRGFVGIDLGTTSSSSSSSAFRKQQTLGVRNRQATALTFALDEPPEYAGPLEAIHAWRGHNLRTSDQSAASETFSSGKPRVVVTFAGTDPKSIKNWIDDIEAAQIAHVYGEDCQDCKVHRGFLAAYQVVQEQVRGTVAALLRNNPIADVLITGHSLGGALATLCFLDLRAFLGENENTATVSFAPLYIYGSPRVGNAAFAEYSASRGVPIFRVVHYRDPVPHLPFKSWGYAHPPREVFFDSPQTSFRVCDESGEDPACSDQFWVMPNLAHLTDHLAYLEVDYTKAYLTCLLGAVDEEEEK